MKKNIAILVGLGVLLYLWNKGFFSKKAPASNVNSLPTEEKFMDANNAPEDYTPMDNNHPGLVGNGEVGSTVYEEFAGQDISSMYATASGLRRKKNFGYIRK
jgi:hypothetical protein